MGIEPPHIHTQQPGWYCTRRWNHEGPCALRPRWWMKLLLKIYY